MSAGAGRAAVLLGAEWSDESPNDRGLDEVRALADRLGLRLAAGSRERAA